MSSSENPSEIARIRRLYATVYRPDVQDRSYPWHACNPISVYYRQALERAIIKMFNHIDLPLDSMRALDVGCGIGNFLRFLATLGVLPQRLFGVDLMPDRLHHAVNLSPPGISFCCGNGEFLPFPGEHFSMVSQFTVFSSILDAAIRNRLATEMLRVLQPGGVLLWYDMQISKSTTLHSIHLTELNTLFAPCQLVALHPLHPPFGTRLSRHSTLLCQLYDTVPVLPKSHILALFRKGD